MIQCRHVTCHACACAGCAALLDELEALRAECDVLETVAENRYATLLEMAAKRDREDQEMIAILTLCWFLRWVLDEDERRALREFRAAYVANANAQWWPEQHERFRQSERRLDAAEREMQRRGL